MSGIWSNDICDFVCVFCVNMFVCVCVCVVVCVCLHVCVLVSLVLHIGTHWDWDF